MCGIAGIIDLTGRRPVPAATIRAMAAAMIHRGPDEDGFLEQPGLAFASRRLSIVGLADGQQPIWNEDRSVGVVFNGELFDYPETRAELASRGHRFITHCDTEIIPHRYEEAGNDLFTHLRGQFAVALWDSRRRQVLLGRDRFGICPLYWSRQRTADGEWLLFASEIKGLLASGLVQPRANLRGLNHVFTFFALPGPLTCFEGVYLLPPGHYLRVQLPGPGGDGRVDEHTYWQPDFPDRGQEEPGDPRRVVDDFERILMTATERRLRADVPVVSYLSGGVDSSTLVALATKVRGNPIPSFTIRIKTPRFDETSQASIVARHIGTEPIVVDCGADEVLNAYPQLIESAEGPVIDTACAALLLLARAVHARGYKVALTGEGADELMAGYPWHKVHKLFGLLDMVPGVRLSQWARGLFMTVTGAPRFPQETLQRANQAVGGYNAWLDIYGLVSMAKLRFFSPSMREATDDHVPHEDLGLDPERMKRWHPLNRELALGMRVQLAGLLLNAKGDRVAMRSSVETRYPFLDEDVFGFLSRLHPRWKFPGLKDKYILRRVAERWLPRTMAWRRKAMFRAPMDSFHLDHVPPFVEQLLSTEALQKTGYFDAEAVQYWRKAFKQLRPWSGQRTSIEMGLVGVFATQLWHQRFLDSSLADLPSTPLRTGSSLATAH